MNARIRKTTPPGRFRPSGTVSRRLIPALLVLAGLATTALGFAWFADADMRMNAYRAAPPCSTAEAHGPDARCVRHEPGTVTAKAVHRGSGPSADDPEKEHKLTVAREAAPTRSYEVGRALYEDVEIGATVDLTVFRGRVAAIAYRGHHIDTPRPSITVYFGTVLLVGLGAALTSHGLSWPRLGPSPARFATVGGAAAGLAFLSGMAFMWLPLSSGLLLALPVLLWLIVTATATAITWND
ncbi:hypothetical protein ABZW10_20985 [Kitasatospora sp. NPDC004723]|uniref:hypothetical protein n=1 Tax=Kitasatospora sp. NPDC004723 TaxID=3154288 RepID=UPI0033A4062E